MELQELSSRNLERFSSFGVPLVMPQKHVIGSAVVGQISCSSSSSTSSAASNATTNTTNSARLVEQKIRKTGRSQGSSANKPVFRARNRSEDSILSPKGVSKPEIQVISALEYESLPDGACFNRSVVSQDHNNGLERLGGGGVSRECHNSSQLTSKRNRNHINNNINNNNNNNNNHHHHRFSTATLDSNMRVTRNAQYLGCFQVQAASQNGRADFVRKQLLQMKDSTEHANVSITISLAGVQVTHQDEEVSGGSFYALRRISYATCEPSTCLMAFLAREPQAPLHLQNCHVFRAPNPEQAEDLNTLVGKAFRTAYAVQLSEERGSDLDPDSSPLKATYTYGRRCRDIPQSRSAESLLSGPSIQEQDPIYECTDFVRESRIRMSDQTLAKTRLSTISRDNLRYRSFHQPDMRPHPRLLPTLPKNVNHVETLISPATSEVSQTSMMSSSRSFAKFRPIKPNTLPVLNCLFAALNNNDEDTPYCEVPPSMSCNNNHINPKKQNGTPTSSSHKSSAYLNESSAANSESSGDSMSHPPHPLHLTMGSNFQHLGKSKSAHLISSCDVYSEVADSMTLINRRTQRRSQNWSIDELRSIPNNGIGTGYRDVTPASDSPSCQSSRTNRGHSSGFSSGEASCTNSSGTTPPPLNASIHQLTLETLSSSTTLTMNLSTSDSTSSTMMTPLYTTMSTISSTKATNTTSFSVPSSTTLSNTTMITSTKSTQTENTVTPTKNPQTLNSTIGSPTTTQPIGSPTTMANDSVTTNPIGSPTTTTIGSQTNISVGSPTTNAIEFTTTKGIGSPTTFVGTPSNNPLISEGPSNISGPGTPTVGQIAALDSFGMVGKTPTSNPVLKA